MTVVTFDRSAFVARYPEFQETPTATLQAYFDEAGAVYCKNSDSSPVSDVTMRKYLLWMVTAHLAALASKEGVGRVDQATEGSVSVHLDMGAAVGSQAWWEQTQYGASFWQATKSYRTFQYRVPQVYPNVYPAPWRM